MTVHVWFANGAGRVVSIDFENELEQAVKYCGIRDEFVRVLVPFCGYCETQIKENDLPAGHLYGELCDGCFDPGRDVNIDTTGISDDVIAAAAKFAGFSFPVWGEINA
jgi:hypothetical protein